jgi:hypothetical protein
MPWALRRRHLRDSASSRGESPGDGETACVEGDKVVGLRMMARLRSEVGALEAKQRDLDGLITALDRRFSTLWASEG